MKNATASQIDIDGKRYLTKLGKEKIRAILLQFGDPLQEQYLVKALEEIGINKKSTKQFIKELEQENLVQRGNHGWRAIN